MKDWEKLARACRRYLDAYDDELADDTTLGSVGNDLRIIAIREVQPARVFFPGDTVPAGVWTVAEGVGRVTSPNASTGPRVARFTPKLEVFVPTLSQFHAAVEQARTEREEARRG